MARFHSSIYIAFLLLLGYIQGISGFGKLTARGIFSSSSKLKAQYKGFDDMLANINQPVLVDFYAEWCGPCKMLQPVLETVAQRLDAVAKVAKVDTEKSPKLAARYQIEALPTMILFNKGQIVERIVGYFDADELEAKVRKAISRDLAGSTL